jgi:hypothetical protein
MFRLGCILIATSLRAVFLAAIYAREGYEDETGFHYCQAAGAEWK